MAEMNLDELSRGAVVVNPQRYAEQGFRASLAAAGEYMKKQKTHDPSKWTKEQWETFVWRILSAGTHTMITLTEENYRAALREIDEIPFET